MGLFRSTDTDAVAERIADGAGPYATPKRVAKVESILYDDEPVHYLALVTALTVADDTGTSDTLEPTKGFARMVVTDRRVAVKIPQLLGSDERSLPFESISAVDLDTSLVKTQLTLKTSGGTYKIKVTGAGKDELREAARFIQSGGPSAPEPEPQQQAETDVVSQLERLRDLRDDGVLTDEEFDTQKQKLLND